MAEYGRANITLSQSRQGYTFTLTGSFYFDITIADAPTTATVTIVPKQSLTATYDTTRFRIVSQTFREGSGSSTIATCKGAGVDTWFHTGLESQQSLGVQNAHNWSISPFTVTKTTSKQTITIGWQGYKNTITGIFMHATFWATSGTSSNDVEITRTDGTMTLPTFSFEIPTITKYTISYNMNGGTGTIGSQQKWHGTNITLSNTRPEKTGYDFQGWSLTQNGSVAYAPGASFGLNQNQTLWAVWKKKTYAVTYYTRTGSPSIAAQTKTYGETLTLSATVPSKTNYTFKGWATSEANAKANTGTIYQKSSQYTSNAALNLYAIWELNHTAPVISSVTAVRCLDNGSANDEGKCAKVSFHWKVFTGSPQYYEGTGTGYQTNKAKTCTITVGSGAVIDTLTIDATDSQMSGTENNVTKILGVSSIYESDSTYPVTITFSDNPPIGSSLSTTARSTLPTAFLPMDFNADASALGFFMPAPNNGNGAYFGKDVHIYVNSATTEGIDGQITQALTNLGWTSVLE